MRAILVFAMLFSITARADMAEIDRLWKARGLQAIEKLEKLIKKNGDSKGKNLSAKEHCDWALENMFIAFANPETSKIVRKSEGETTVFKVLFVDETKVKNRQITQVNFIYNEKKSKTPDAYAVMLVADDWAVSSVAKVPNHILILSDKCSFLFPTNDPLSAIADANADAGDKLK